MYLYMMRKSRWNLCRRSNRQSKKNFEPIVILLPRKINEKLNLMILNVRLLVTQRCCPLWTGPLEVSGRLAPRRNIYRSRPVSLLNFSLRETNSRSPRARGSVVQLVKLKRLPAHWTLNSRGASKRSHASYNFEWFSNTAQPRFQKSYD